MGNDKQIRILKQFLCIFAILFDTYFSCYYFCIIFEIQQLLLISNCFCKHIIILGHNPTKHLRAQIKDTENNGIIDVLKVKHLLKDLDGSKPHFYYIYWKNIIYVN